MRGFTAFDTDSIPGATGFDYADTGLPVPAGIGEPTNPIDFQRFAWNLRLDALSDLLASADDVFICAITSNTVELRHLFDRVFVLRVDTEMLRQRLGERAGHAFGRDCIEAEGVIAHNRVIADEWRARGGVVIDANQPLASVVDDIIAALV